MIRSYRLQNSANNAKLDAVAEILPHWQRGLVHVQYIQVCALKRGQRKLGWLDSVTSKTLPTYLSQRQWKSVVNQVNASLASWQGGAVNGVRKLIADVDCEPDVRADLYRINHAKAWWSRDTLLYTLKDGTEVVVSEESLELSRTLIALHLSKHPFPYLAAVRTMLMDGPIAGLSTSTDATHADLWVKVATLTKGKPVNIPLHIDSYTNAAAGVTSNFCQVNVSHTGVPSFSIVKKSTNAKARSEGSVIGMDWGLVSMFTTSDGRILGGELYTWLKARDKELSKLVAGLNAQGIKLRDSRRYRNLNSRIRSYVRNEVGRIINTLTDEDIKEIVVEDLDFRSSRMSRAMNRIMTRAGRGAVSAKLASLTEEFGIKVTAVNPAYTSQCCSSCGFSAKQNRTSQAKFKCRFCGLKLLADVNAARNILQRRSLETEGLRYKSKSNVLAIVDGIFVDRWSCNPALIRERLVRGSSTAISANSAGSTQDGLISTS